jgi:hypothetical protein
MEANAGAYIDAWQKKAAFYERVGLYDTIMRFINTVPAGSRAIEFGVGAGNLLERLVAAGATCVGVDVARPALEITKSRLEARGYGADIYVARGPGILDGEPVETWHPPKSLTALFRRGRVTLLGEDYETAAVLRHYHEKADLITLVCTGGVRAVVGADMAQTVSDVHLRLGQKEARGILSASDLLVSGGRLIYLQKGFLNLQSGTLHITTGENVMAHFKRIFAPIKSLRVTRAEVLDVSQAFLENAEFYESGSDWHFAVDLPDRMREITAQHRVAIGLCEVTKR